MCRQLEQLRRNFEQQVEPLLLGQAADHGQQGAVVTRLETELGAQFGLVGGLGRQLPRVVAAHQMRIGGRVPDGGVDAVEYAGELSGTMSQQVGHAHAFGIGLNFAGVSRAHRGDGIGMLQAGLEKREIAVILHAVHAPCRVGQAEFEQRGVVEQALERQVVHGE